MKTSIKLTALFLLATTGLFAAVPTASKSAEDAKTDVITFSALKSNVGVDVNIEKNSTGKTLVLIMDKDSNVIYKEALPQYKNLEKGYVFSQLENGDYTIEVVSNNQVEKKSIHVYDEDDKKMFFINQ